MDSCIQNQLNEVQRNVQFNSVANDNISKLKEKGENPKWANLTKALFICGLQWIQLKSYSWKSVLVWTVISDLA